MAERMAVSPLRHDGVTKPNRHRRREVNRLTKRS